MINLIMLPSKLSETINLGIILATAIHCHFKTNLISKKSVTSLKVLLNNTKSTILISTKLNSSAKFIYNTIMVHAPSLSKVFFTSNKIWLSRII